MNPLPPETRTESLIEDTLKENVPKTPLLQTSNFYRTNELPSISDVESSVAGSGQCVDGGTVVECGIVNNAALRGVSAT